MKSKAILFLLSLSILLSTPIFAAIDMTSSSLLADQSEATMLKSTKTSLKIEIGETEDLAKYVSLLVDETHAANPSELIWSIENNEDEFANSGSSYTALVDSGKATAVVSTDDGRLTLEIELTAVKKEVATGFKFEQSHYDIPCEQGIGIVPDADIRIIPTPEGSEFTLDQMKKIADKANNYDPVNSNPFITLCVQLGMLPPATEKSEFKIGDNYLYLTWKNSIGDDGKYDFGTTVNNLGKEMKKTLEIDGFPLPNGKTAKRKSQEVTFKIVDPPTSLGNGGTLKINVGEEFELSKWLMMLPATANTVFEAYDFSFEGYGDDDEIDYIAYDKDTNKIRGVKAGKLKVTAACPAFYPILQLQTTFAIVVEPFKEDEKKDTSLVAPQRALAVGESFTAAFGSEVTEEQAKTATYGSLNEDIATVDSNGVVTAVKAGTAKIWVEVEGYEKGYYTVTVTDGASTDVPMTATVALAPLF